MHQKIHRKRSIISSQICQLFAMESAILRAAATYILSPLVIEESFDDNHTPRIDWCSNAKGENNNSYYIHTDRRQLRTQYPFMWLPRVNERQLFSHL